MEFVEAVRWSTTWPVTWIWWWTKVHPTRLQRQAECDSEALNLI
jgi:hypothetical protein